MLPGRCLTLGGSRRLSTLHSTASCQHFSRLGITRAPCRALHSSQFCECSSRDAHPIAPAGNKSATVTARAAPASAACGPDLDAILASCSSSVAASAPSTPKDAAHGASLCCVSSTGNGSNCATGDADVAAAHPSGASVHGRVAALLAARFADLHSSGSSFGSSSRSGGSCGAAAVGGAAGPGPGSVVEDTTHETWLTPLRRPGSVVALGKFDALHRGHRALAAAAAALAREIHAVQSGGAEHTPSAAAADDTAATGTAAAAAGDAVLLSFSGMAAVLGWPDRLPLTAPQDRGRVLAGWAAACSGRADCNGNVVDAQLSAVPASVSASGAAGGAVGSGVAGPPPPPRLRTLPFSLIRSMAPEQFVALLARDLGAQGVVAGRNYRFGYKAAGDADTLVRLGRQYGMRVEIVDLVTLPDQPTATVTATLNGLDGVGGGSSSSCCSSGDSGSNGCAAVSMPPGAMNVGATEAVAGYYGASNTSFKSVDGPGGPVGSGRGGGGGGGAAGSSSRVSSSRIRELLERGQVESVEQLLGRKYRLVCDLAATTATTAGSAGGKVSSGDSSSSNSENNGSASKSGEFGGGHWRAAGGTGRLVLPSASYQNQPPANGQYRTLVQLVRGSQVPIEPGAVGDSAGYDFVVDGEGSLEAGLNMSGGACVMVTLSDLGLEVELGAAGLQCLASMAGGGLLLVDFDACGS